MKNPNKLYSATHYEQFTEEDWKRATEERVFPKNESAPTFLVGAYLIALKKTRQITSGLYSPEFSKVLRLAKDCIAYFDELYEGEGFKVALEYTDYFLAHDEKTFIGRSRWSLELMLTKTSYRNYVRNTQAQSNTYLSHNNMGTTIQKDQDRGTIQFKRS